MKLSIIVPVYNVEKYITRCLDSVVNQSYSNIECLIVNDCTPDSSAIIAKQFVDEYEGPILFKIIEHEKNKGLSAARNTGIRQSTGEYIYFLDSDDAIPENAISDLVHTAKCNDYPEIVMGYTQGIDANGNRVEVTPIKPQVRSYASNVELFNAYLNGQFYVIACNKLIRRDIFDEHNTYFREGITHEDVMWSFEVATYVQRVIGCDKVTYHYHLENTNSISRSKLSEKRVRDSFFIMSEKAKYIGRTCNDKALATHIKNDVRTMIYALYRQGFNRKFIKECIGKVKELEAKTTIHNAKCTIPWYRQMVIYFLKYTV